MNKWYLLKLYLQYQKQRCVEEEEVLRNTQLIEAKHFVYGESIFADRILAEMDFLEACEYRGSGGPGGGITVEAEEAKYFDPSSAFGRRL